MITNDTKNRILQEAHFVIETHSTMRTTAKFFKVSKSTVHLDLTERLPRISPSLANQTSLVIAENKAERAMRGGLATRQKYVNLKCCPKTGE